MVCLCLSAPQQSVVTPHGSPPCAGLLIPQPGWQVRQRLHPAHRYGTYRGPQPGKVHLRPVGDYGFELCANCLELGCDYLGNVRYLDVVDNNAMRGPAGRTNGV
ncbi:hypothetical protein Vretifemale_32 [Volvox reticuliferus]|uniref:Uncharacterized protein n=1 Tax=Volvox reticuliferus TaxID=1737510 RepID=A0A8J4BUN2_9CHLO|nr:hypothetical protein Vretifemale_32 [Volvox reticuliferus]